MLTPANPEAEQAVLETIMAPEEEAKLALNPQLALQFPGPIAPPTVGHLLVRGAE